MNTSINEHQETFEILGFSVGLTYRQHNRDGKVVYHYTVVTPTNVDFHGDSLTVPSLWELERIAAEAAAWICVGRDDGVDDDYFDSYNGYQLTWLDSLNREYARADIDEYIENLDRKGTANMETENNSTLADLAGTVHARAQMYVDDYILANQTGLVEHLLGLEDDNWLSIDDIANLYPDTSSMDCYEVTNFYDDHFGGSWKDLIDINDYITEVEEGDTDEDGNQLLPEDPKDRLINLTAGELHDYDVEMLQEYVRDHYEPGEIFEWWLVTSWLAQELEAEGQATISDGRSHWWGRRTTGQYILMDGVLQRIAAKYV